MAVPVIAKAVLRLKYGEVGWTETYGLAGLNIAQNLNITRALAYGRRALMAVGGIIQRAGVHHTGRPRDKRSAISGPLPAFNAAHWTNRTGLTDENHFYLNDPTTSLMFSFETATGKEMQRHFTGLPDFLVVRKQANQNASLELEYPVNVTQAMMEQTDLGWATMMRNFISFVRDNTVLIQAHQLTPPPNATFNYDLHPLVKCTFEEVRKRNRGRPFRLSHGKR